MKTNSREPETEAGARNAAGGTSRRKKLGVYVHIPFCKRRCRYCNFLSDAETGAHERALYVSQLKCEIAGKGDAYGDKFEVDTVFIGGGTPTILSHDEIDDVIESVYSRFRVADDAEITVESNPGTVDRAYLERLKESGVNRLSIGVQSFNGEMLELLGRVHSSSEAIGAFEAARAADFDNVNIDLIFGMPGQSVGLWREDLHRAVALGPDHISFYDLQIEEETPIYEDLMSGLLEPISDISDRRMYHAAIETLTNAGYEHYEISNAARPGRRSRHNLKYWSMDDYLGVGLGAHSYIAGRRFVNTEFRSDYITAHDSDHMVSSYYNNTRGDEMSEYIFLGLRRTEGISLSDFALRFGEDFYSLYSTETENLIERRLLKREGDMLKLTPLGLDLSNIVFREFV
jgi:oxygen-independent coproporphyrinogen-3 oxidase